jgi:hypothetical protein
MTYSRISLFAFIFILISDVIVRTNSFIGESNGSTLAVAILNVLTSLGLLVLCYKSQLKNKMPYYAWLAFYGFMAWNIFQFTRGVFNAQDYWDWKEVLLRYSFSIIIPLAIIVGLNHELNIKLSRFILRIVFAFGFAVIPLALLTDFELYARIVMAISLFIIFIPWLPYKWKILVFIVALTSAFVDLSYRINAIKIVFSCILLLVYFNRKFISRKVLNLCAGFMFIFPLILFYLGVSGQYNIFQDNTADYVVATGSHERGATVNLSIDTRTFLFQEVFYSMLKRDSSFVIGEGGGSAYESPFFSMYDLNERGRYGTEVGFINAVLYSGAIGVLLYMLMLMLPAYYAINKSNNYSCKLLGLFVTFHWVVFFIEDRTLMTMNFYFIWLAIGLCLSNQYRALSDDDVSDLFRSIGAMVKIK